MIWKINHVVELIKLSPICDRSDRDWTRRIVIVEYGLRRSLGSSNNLAVGLSWLINAFSPLPFNATVDAQWINGAH
jgi:hypothetical protein